MFAQRSVGAILRSPFERRHYTALRNMMRLYLRPAECLRRYLLGTGAYPFVCPIRTPTGVVQPVLYSHHDMLTANEIFCREDYAAGPGVGVVVDIGSNIGLSALYFLSRNAGSRCYLYEPDPRNVARLRDNLRDFGERVRLAEKAVADRAGLVSFGIESSGRYGGIGVETGTTITVECLGINDVLEDVLSRHGAIDILKIDTEGMEVATVGAIDTELMRRIGRIYLEARPREDLGRGIFRQSQYGAICRLVRRRNAAAH